jgi:hypothetical protein
VLGAIAAAQLLHEAWQLLRAMESPAAEQLAVQDALIPATAAERPAR